MLNRIEHGAAHLLFSLVMTLRRRFCHALWRRFCIAAPRRAVYLPWRAAQCAMSSTCRTQLLRGHVPTLRRSSRDAAPRRAVCLPLRVAQHAMSSARRSRRLLCRSRDAAPGRAVRLPLAGSTTRHVQCTSDTTFAAPLSRHRALTCCLSSPCGAAQHAVGIG